MKYHEVCRNWHIEVGCLTDVLSSRCNVLEESAALQAWIAD
jgi:hypothetical protein